MTLARYGLEFRVLGPLEVTRDGRPAHVGGIQPRNLLARLLVDVGRRVSVPALVEELWGEHGPADAERTARTYVSRLRKSLSLSPGPDHGPGQPCAARAGAADEELVTVAGGYEMRIDPGAVDAVRFERLATAGRRHLERGEPRLAAEHLAAALALWRGDAYAEFGECATVSAEGARLDRLRLTVLEDRFAAALALGLDADLISELEGLARAYPQRERLWGQLMVGLYRSGRQAEALTAYQEARTALVDLYGIEPSPALAEIHHKILTHDRSLVETATDPSPASSGPAHIRTAAERAAERVTAPVPAQLPIGVRDFTGRRVELARLDALLAGRRCPPWAVICAVSGTAGVGKSSLVIHWAGQVADRFPDGQLYVDLHGFAPSGGVLDPAEALRGLLDALGVPAERIPVDVHARVALYRSMLAGRRILVVLDNARDASQVRPLLPSTPGSMAVVTSRTTLAGLEVAERAHRLVLDVLTRGEAHELLASRLGPHRAATDRADADDIINRCARLPLALAIAAARPGASPSRLAAWLRANSGGLDAFDLGDDAVSLRAAFSWSYKLLTEPSARLFRLLGCHARAEVSAAEAACLTGLGHQRTRECLRELLDANLIAERSPGRYASHELLRSYAVECAEALEMQFVMKASRRHSASHVTTSWVDMLGHLDRAS